MHTRLPLILLIALHPLLALGGWATPARASLTIQSPPACCAVCCCCQDRCACAVEAPSNNQPTPATPQMTPRGTEARHAAILPKGIEGPRPLPPQGAAGAVHAAQRTHTAPKAGVQALLCAWLT